LNVSTTAILRCTMTDGELAAKWIFQRRRKIHNRGLSLSIWIWWWTYFGVYLLR